MSTVITGFLYYFNLLRSYIMDRIIDTHCHPQFPQYDGDRDEVIRRALDGGVQMICVGTDAVTSRQAIELAEQYEGLWASVGLHPNDLGEDFSEFETLIKHPKVVAVGEIGLDYYRSADRRGEQIDRLKYFLSFASTHHKPVIIHCRDSSTPLTMSAHDDMLAMLPDGRGVIHSFTGTLEQATAYIKKGYCIGLNGIVTFSPEYEEMVRGLPLDRILLETDSPYLAPAPYRGKRNEPFYIVETAKAIAKMRNMPVEELISVTSKNTSITLLS